MIEQLTTTPTGITAKAKSVVTNIEPKMDQILAAIDASIALMKQNLEVLTSS
jgi:hypothetical protein